MTAVSVNVDVSYFLYKNTLVRSKATEGDFLLGIPAPLNVLNLQMVMMWMLMTLIRMKMARAEHIHSTY